MSWMPNDLVSDADLVAYERTLFTAFNVEDWQARRQKALEDWLFPLLEGRGYPVQRLRTRFIPSKVFGYTSSAYTDKTTAAQTSDGLDLAVILAGASDALYVGFTDPFRGLSLRQLDAVNATATAPTFALWNDAWVAPENLINDTIANSIPFAKGGAVLWTLPESWVPRAVNSSDPLYWLKLTVSVVPTGAKVGPITVIRRSRLCAAVTFRTLSLIFREAPTSQDGPWLQKAEFYEAEAERAWLRVVGYLGSEFDVDGDDAISDDEAEQTDASVTGGGWTLERA